MPRPVAVDTTVSKAELLEFIRPRHRGVLLARRRDGGPQMSLVTMGVDDAGRVVISSYPERAKSRNVERDGRAAVLVMSDSFNEDWVQVEGPAEVLHLPEALEPLCDYYRAISGEHPDWDEYRDAMTHQGKVLIRITIERWSPISRGGFPARLVEGAS